MADDDNTGNLNPRARVWLSEAAAIAYLTTRVTGGDYVQAALLYREGARSGELEIWGRPRIGRPPQLIPGEDWHRCVYQKTPDPLFDVLHFAPTLHWVYREVRRIALMAFATQILAERHNSRDVAASPANVHQRSESPPGDPPRDAPRQTSPAPERDVTDEDRPRQTAAVRRPRRGPVAGETNQVTQAREALYPVIKKLRKRGESWTKAVDRLATEGKIVLPGGGSRANQVAKLAAACGESAKKPRTRRPAKKFRKTRENPSKQ